MKEGLSGNIAKAFIQSKLTILLMIAFLLIGGYSTMLIPREEEPQINVPMADIFLRYPGASPKEVEARVSQPLEKIISNIKGVEYVYSTSMKGEAMVIVQFYVGEDVERSLVKLYNELMKNMDKMPVGVSMPLVKTRAIDDVPVLGLTLWSEKYSDYELKQLGQTLSNEIKKIPDVASINILGGRSRQVNVLLDKDRMVQRHVDFLSIAKQIQGNNAQSHSGDLIRQDTAFSVDAGNFLKDAYELEDIVVGIDNGLPVYLKEVATIEEGPEKPIQHVFFGFGQYDPQQAAMHKSVYPAITLSIAKKKGADAMKLSEHIVAKIEHLKSVLIPDDVHVTQTRNYGETASEKVSELLLHLFVAVLAVTAFVMLAMGWRGGLVVFLSVPVTFALTLFSYYFLDYTLNRITLFALVFITGIVVDDSIIIAENMHRHFKMRRLPFLQAAIFAINEVGNPTILATFTVIAAVLPMAFVSGMMGPYMSPMPIGASIAMMLSLVVALTLTPYLGYVFLREKEGHDDKGPIALEQSKIYKLYKAFINPMLETRWKRWAFILSTVIVLLGSVSFFYTKWVAVKMLPFDNKNEFQVVIDMPEGTTLERTAVVTREISQYLSQQKLVRNYQGYVGTAGPISFNGLVRHYDLRSGNNVADIQVNLVDKKDRSTQSHEIAKQYRPAIQKIARKYNANVKMVEVPPGPPVLSTIVAEIYGPDYQEQIRIAREVKVLIEGTEGAVDVDWMTEADQPEYRIEVDKEKAMGNGIAPAQVVATIQAALSNMPAGTLHNPVSFDPISIVLQLRDADITSVDDIRNLSIINQHGNAIAISDLVKIKKEIKEKSIYRKNQKRVVYVLADLAGDLESPFYAIMEISEKLKSINLKKGFTLEESYNQQPAFEDNYTLKWDGEWQITYEVFRDLGIAFAVVIIMIYMLIVGWFQDFKVPLVMLAAIPLSLIGIVLGHWMLGAYFTATSMIGFIALAGVMVRNSVLLIDFINIRLEEGIPLKQAIIEAGAVRTTPILLTAGAVVLGAVIILFDPIFQGLAISLMGGTITSTFLTLLVVPLLYYRMMRKKHEKH
ncbi:MAG: efflux RND transporter permease subunit [Cyclobacteriaceae bacterium]|nr:efflux RND transporter permease subunit [Cyclobacteriaceae bacterium]MDH5250575.1 efflux RND transporter permease subunit [Cyclobacteriaceae bacterium]